MKILVVTATLEEIKPALPFLEGQGIPYLVTGVGMVSTTYALGRHLQQHPTDLLLHVGIGGILNSHSPLGEIYRISNDELFGLGAEDHHSFISIEELGFGKRLYAEKIPPEITLPKTQAAQGITVNTVHGSSDSIQRLKQRYSMPLVESMEGAAAFFVAEQEGLYCLQYRAISNYIEPRNRDQWEIGLAIKNLNDFLVYILSNLNH